MAAGYAPGYTTYAQEQEQLRRILAASSQAPPTLDNSQAGLTQRYGATPETYDQLAIINGWNQPTPRDGNPVTPSGPPMLNPIPTTPAPTTPAPAPGGSGNDLNSLLNELLADARSGKYLDSINSAYNLQSKQALEGAGLQTTDDLATLGMLPQDSKSRDLNARLIGQAMSPIAANRAAAIADAQQMQGNRIQSVAGMMSEMQARDEARKRQEAADAEARRQFDATMSYNQSQAAYRQSQDNQARQDELNRQAQLRAAMTGGGGLQSAPSSGPAGGGGGQASPSFFDLIAGQPGYTINGQGGGDSGAGGGGGYAGGGGSGGGGGTNFLPTLNGGSNAGLWDDGKGGTTWHNPNNQKPQASPTSFSGVASGGGATSFAKPPGASPAPTAAAAPVPGGGQVMGGSQQVGFGGGPANSPSFNTPAGFAGYGQSWNSPQLAGQAAGVRTGRRDDIFNAATGRYA